MSEDAPSAGIQAHAQVQVIQPPPVSIGFATIAGTSISVVAFVLAVIAAVTGHGTAQTTEVITAGATGLAVSAITLIGRFLQARELAKVPPLAMSRLPS